MKRIEQGNRDPFVRLRSLTEARIGLGRTGQALPTRPLLDFQFAHAQARDAVHAGLDIARLQEEIGAPSIVVSSRAPDRATYLRNPGLGRRLDAADAAQLKPCGVDLAVVIADGLSAAAVHKHATPLYAALADRLQGLSFAPPVIARQARVALGDEIGEALGARIVLILIGERPGLSAPDSLGAYLTWQPKLGRADSERNCVSNIRTPGGLTTTESCDRITWLIRAAIRLGLTGIELKEASTPALAPPDDQQALTHAHDPSIGS